MLTVRCRAYSDEQTIRALKAQLKLATEVYNTLRWADIYFYQRDGKGLTQTELRQLALDLRKQDKEYQQLYSQVVQQIADRYYEAKKRFLEGLSRFPREKKVERYKSLVYPQRGWKIIAVRSIRHGKKKLAILSLSKLGIFKVILHKNIDFSKVSRVAVKLEESEKVYISFILDEDVHEETQKTGKVVALDLGVSHLFVTSDGEYVNNPKFIDRALKRLKHLNRELSRKVVGSHNFEKARVKLARMYEHIVNQKRDFYNKLAKYLVTRYDVIILEDLNVRKMLEEAPRTLARHIQDASFYMFRRILEWQALKHGKEVKTVNPAYTSQTCVRCGTQVKLSLSDRVFHCPKCGLTLDRDFHASLNILKRAGWEPPLVPVEPSLRVMKQEASPFKVR